VTYLARTSPAGVGRLAALTALVMACMPSPGCVGPSEELQHQEIRFESVMLRVAERAADLHPLPLGRLQADRCLCCGQWDRLGPVEGRGFARRIETEARLRCLDTARMAARVAEIPPERLVVRRYAERSEQPRSGDVVMLFLVEEREEAFPRVWGATRDRGDVPSRRW
jgi:hypothetical protein